MKLGDIHPNPVTHEKVSPGQRMLRRRQAELDLLERIRLAEQVGLDFFGIGEHHRPDYAVSAHATVLAGAAGQTSSIGLSSAVTVLSTEDPVRVFQQFATIDLISKGAGGVDGGPRVVHRVLPAVRGGTERL
jgi:alkanesulfonate monooxygenase SsuD/methylene tetrahydromethanopterin reductase-like flavin-dependent oxidoreductase (luciferase family)